MPATANLQNKSISANSYAKKIATVCAMQGIPSGKAGNLATFMRALNDDKFLAMNFWSLVVKISDQENGSNEALLEAIAQGVTGKSVAEIEAAGGEPGWLIRQMASMLAGEDVDISAASHAVAAPETVVGEEISRVAVEAPALVLTPPAPLELPVSAEAPRQPFLLRNDCDRSRLVLEPETVASKPPIGQRALFGTDVPKENVRTLRVPLEGYGASIASGKERLIVFALLTALGLGGGAFFVRGDGAALQQKFGPSIRAGYDSAWRGVKGLANWANNVAR